MTPGLPSWPATLQVLALVVSPRLGLRHPKGWVWFMLSHLHPYLEKFEEIFERDEIIEF
jgi:hypothetical protein